MPHLEIGVPRNSDKVIELNTNEVAEPKTANNETAERNVTESVEREVGWQTVEKVVVRRRRYWCDGGGRGGMEYKDEIESLS
ncbi:hypothetical protein Tco_0344909 [Tanacetum coccineum]